MESDVNTPKTNEGLFKKHRHTLMMMLCCMIPLVLLGVLWLSGVSQNILYIGILVLCPIMHLLMMRNMKHCTPESQIDEDKKEELT